MTHVCPQCGARLRADVLDGQCPGCLGSMALGFATGSPAPDPSRKLGLGEFELLREVGRGGMGVVYEAWQRQLNRRVAIKMLSGVGFGPGRERLKARFYREAEAAARLNHPGIVTIHEVGDLDGQPFFAMEFIDGPNLSGLAERGSLTAAQVAHYVRAVAEAIAHAHQRGVLHRDLKPANVLIDSAGRPRVTDFGLAKHFDSTQELTRSGELLGSPGYIAPEILAGAEASQATDIHALGGILYHLLTGHPPFHAPTVAATLELVRQGEPPAPSTFRPTVERDLETICLKCLHRDPARRYASAAELVADLVRFQQGEPVLARAISDGEKAWRWCRRHPGVVTLLLALTVTLAAGSGAVVWQWRRAEHNRVVLERNLYAADVAAASTALRDGNLGRARELLRAHAPNHPPPSGSDAETGTAIDLREFTWQLLWTRSQSMEQMTLGDHAWIVTAVGISPDEHWAASGSMGQNRDSTNVLRLWDLRSPAAPGTPPFRTATNDRHLPARHSVWSVAFTSDSRTLISSGAGAVQFWDVSTGRETTAEHPSMPAAEEFALAANQLIGSPNHPFLPQDAPQPLWHCDLRTGIVRTLSARGWHPTLSREGRWLAYVDERQQVKIRELATDRELLTVATNQRIFRLRFAPEGRGLLAAGQGNGAQLWEFAHDFPANRSVSPPVRFPHERNIWEAQFSSDGKQVLLGTSDQKIQLWSRDGSELKQVWLGHENEVWAIGVAESGKRLISGGKDRTIRAWAGPSSTQAPPLLHWRYAVPFFSPDGEKILTYAQTNWVGAASVSLLPKSDPESGPKPTAALAGFPRGFSPDGQHVLFWEGDRHRLIWAPWQGTGTRREVQVEANPRDLLANELRLSGNAKWVIAPHEAGVFGRWSTEDGHQGGRWADPRVASAIQSSISRRGKNSRIFRTLEVSHGGRWFAFGSPLDSQVYLVDLERGTEQVLAAHQDEVVTLTFSRDDRRLATGSVDGSVRLWDVATGSATGVLLGHLESVEAVAFSPDGQTLASANPGIEVRFWHVPTLRELAILNTPEMGHSLTFSPDGRRLAVGLIARRGEETPDRLELWTVPP